MDILDKYLDPILEIWLPSKSTRLIMGICIILAASLSINPEPVLQYFEITPSDKSLLRARETVPLLLLVFGLALTLFLTRHNAASCKSPTVFKFHKTIKLSLDDDYFDLTGRDGKKLFRISLKGVSKQLMPPPYEYPADEFHEGIECDAATICFSSFLVHSGAYVKKLAIHQFSSDAQFLMSKNEYPEEPYSVFFFRTEHTTDGEEFFRCFVEHINIAKKEVELNIHYIWTQS
jgi:hypothetical protein